MRIFAKIFLSIFCLSIILISVYCVILIKYQISYAEQKVIEQNKILGSFLSEEIRIGYFQSQWPYESLSELTKKKDFLFWWVVKEDGIIYRSDNTSFMGTKALDYFPRVAEIIADESVYSNADENYAIYTNSFKVGKNNWEFWLGFSTTEFQSIKKTIFTYFVIFFGVSLAIFGTSLYFIVSFFTKPINSLLEGTMAVAKGDMDYAIKIKSGDEIGNLGTAFNAMTKDLKKSRQELEAYSKELEQKVKERTAELEMERKSLEQKVKERTAELEGLKIGLEQTVAERTKTLQEKYADIEKINKLMIGRELKMAELKKEIDELKKKLA